jgi:hypothetical protein
VTFGQKVKAIDTETGKSVTRSATAVWVNHDTDLMEVAVTAGGGSHSTIHTTQHHPFWDLTTHTWVDADHLRTGDQLLADNGASVTFTATVIVPGAADMLDLTIDGVHDFHITTGSDTVLVHSNSNSNSNSNSCSFAHSQLRASHFSDHGSDFGAKSPAEYEQQASTFLDGPKSANTLEKIRPQSGDAVRFDPATDEFGVLSRNSVIKTYYRPDPAVHGYPTNLDYFNAQ